MAKERLSKLQKWILKTTLNKGEKDNEARPFILRRHLIHYWIDENCKLEKWDNYWERQKEARQIKPKFNVSLSRSIRSLHEKGFIKIFSLYTADSYLRLIGSAFKQGAQMAMMARGLKRLAKEDTTKEDETIESYEATKRARNQGSFQLIEIKDSKKSLSIQALALTKEGEEVASKC